MPKPIIILIDDEPEVLQAVERDVRRRYGKEYRVMKAISGHEGLSLLQQIGVRGEVVALFLSDHRMPKMNGIEFLKEAEAIFPAAKRVLLTAYADSSAAIQAINDIKLDYYLMKPWDPPEDLLYPVIDDLLSDWQANNRSPFGGIRVVGQRWSSYSHAIKDFLGRNGVPYQWIDLEHAEGQRLVQLSGIATPRLPLVLFPDGQMLENPLPVQIAEKIGRRTQADRSFYDLVIIGGGPAGLAAAVYGASEGLSTVLIEREAPGGQAGTSSRIENYLGFPTGLSGADLSRRAVSQALRFGVEMLAPQEVVKLRIEDPYRVITLADGTEITCHALVIATGVSYRTLNVPGIEQLTGLGVYYGASLSEARSYQDEDITIVGGANSAGQAALYFSRYARSVTILIRGSSLTKSMSYYLINEIERQPNITVRTHTQVKEVQGTERLEQLVIENSETGERETIPMSALFIFIGAMPHTDWLNGIIERDSQGFIVSGSDLIHDGKRPKGWTLERNPYLLETNIPGIFVAGDARSRSIKRVASSVGEGAIAVQFVHQYLSNV
ncbi:fused response regulator/thioredoxin-disulfide reductase [Dictyobacter alpinus]|uniref:Fused response regulator/thioredoxin-disulfide reductase n=1 Tax=Dictyobacter alpinus TaxID=2014873 RepID=A0A402BFN1_9CHLR|nr:FAD-dependent oxidoreductase [Dictyobacter alpinus]GCE30077.1 fused response regulator/thioredoxin-disulfide reductase [Dictyobacter alpinus]